MIGSSLGGASFTSSFGAKPDIIDGVPLSSGPFDAAAAASSCSSFSLSSEAWLLESAQMERPNMKVRWKRIATLCCSAAVQLAVSFE